MAAATESSTAFRPLSDDNKAGSHGNDEFIGTVLVVGAAFVFALVAMVVQIDPLPLVIATECRYLVSWLISLVFMFRYRVSRNLHFFGPAELRTWLVLKCTLQFFFVVLWWAAIRHAPLGDCIALIYSAPILTSLLARAFLQEALPRHFLVQVLLAVTGTVLIVDPPALRAMFGYSGGEAEADHTLVFLAMFAAALLPIVTRKARDCSWIEVEHVSACLGSVVLGPALLIGQYLLFNKAPLISAPMTSTTMPSVEILLIALASVGSFVGLAMETKGYQLAEVGKASMFRYLEVPFGYLLQCIGTSSPIKTLPVIGSILVLASSFLGIQ